MCRRTVSESTKIANQWYSGFLMETVFKSGANALKILGIDPGSRIAGFALLESRKPNPIVPRDFRVLQAGVIRLDVKQDISFRLGHLHQVIHEMCGQEQPDVCVIEKAFCGVNANSALKLGEIRGAVISAVRRSEVRIAQLTPASIKMIVAGKGQASKEEVADAVEHCLQFERGKLPHDATDAVAIALAFGVSMHSQSWS